MATYYYCSATGKRILGSPGTPEFIASFAQAARREAVDTGTFGSLLKAYVASPEFQRLAEKTRRDYRRYVDHLRSEFGDMPLAATNDPRVRKVFYDWRDKIAGTPRHADYAWSVLRRVLAWALNRRLITANHALKPGRLYAGDRSDIIWTDSDIEKFNACASTELQWALALALYTGQRQGDLLRLTWNQFDGTHIRLKQGKRGRNVAVLVHEKLRPIIDTIPKRQLTILTTKSGISWKEDHFRHEWREATLLAGLDGLHFHDLRGTAITRLAECGCTSSEIAALTGHSLDRVAVILDSYTARTERLGDSAIRKWENAGRTNSANQLQTGDKKNGTGSA